MNVGAHPLVVAVALGLLGPGVLSEVQPPDGCGGERCPCREGAEPVEGCTEAAPEADPLDVAQVEAIWSGMAR